MILDSRLKLLGLVPWAPWTSSPIPCVQFLSRISLSHVTAPSLTLHPCPCRRIHITICVDDLAIVTFLPKKVHLFTFFYSLVRGVKFFAPSNPRMPCYILPMRAPTSRSRISRWLCYATLSFGRPLVHPPPGQAPPSLASPRTMKRPLAYRRHTDEPGPAHNEVLAPPLMIVTRGW